MGNSVVKPDRHKIVVRVDGHKGIGMGHLYRMITLSNFMRKKGCFDFVFIVRNNQPACDLLQKHQFRIYPVKFNISQQDELEQISRIIKYENPKVIIVDLIKRCFDDVFMKSLKEVNNSSIIVFTDVHKRFEVDADLVFNVSLYQEYENYKAIVRPKYYLGFDYVILDPDYAHIKNGSNVKNNVKKVLVCMGGADHHNLTFDVLKAIDESKHDFCCDVIVSSAFFEKDKVDEFLKMVRHKTRVYYDLDGILERLLHADLAITAGGNTHIERMCAGVPGIVVSQLRHQAISVKKISELGATLDFGMHKNMNFRRLLEQFNELFQNRELRKQMVKNGRSLVDGNGLLRVSKIITEAITGQEGH